MVMKKKPSNNPNGFRWVTAGLLGRNVGPLTAADRSNPRGKEILSSVFGCQWFNATHGLAECNIYI